MPRNLTSPVGRFVQGDCFEMQTTDQQGRPRVVKNGPNIGQPSPQLFIGVAFAKSDPAWPAFWAELVAEAAEGFKNLFPGGPQPHAANGGCILPTFAFKVVDGDGYDTTGKPNAQKEGFAGHWVVRFTGGFAVKVFRPVSGAHVEITNPKEIKRGDYIRVACSIKPNGDTQKPGLYVNPSLVELVGYGQEIVSGPSAADAFAQPAALPPGASPVPIAPAAMPPGAGAPPPAAPGYAAPPAQGYMPPPAAAPPAQGYMPPPAAAPPAAAPPAYAGFVPGAAPPQAYAAPPAAPPAPAPTPPAAPVRQMTAAAQYSYEQYISACWTDAQLVQNGLMAA